MGASGEPTLRHVVLGEGEPLVLCPGFALHPRTYTGTIALLARDARVVVPSLFATGRRWRYETLLDAMTRLLDELGIGTATLVGHSFGGGIALGFAARHPQRVGSLVLCNSLGVSQQWALAREALWHTNFARLATADATGDFFRSLLGRPRLVAGAGWWAFRVDKAAEIETVRSAPMTRHVVWTPRDTLLSPANGARFAELLDARHTVVDPSGTPGVVDHDWVYRHPELAARTLARIGVLPAAAPAGDAQVPR